jgi:phospholipase C
MSGPGWPKTLLIWNYDEHGGYYDHVPPPLLDTDPGALACNTSGPGTIPPPGSVTPPHHHHKAHGH